MSRRSCAKCLGCGSVCTGCGRDRPLRRPKWGDASGHSRCPRRPGGVIPCPSHTETLLTCDACGLSVPYHEGTRRHGWKYEHPLDHCPNCVEQIAVALDAVGGLDMRAVGHRAFANLLNGLKRLDLSILTAAEVVRLRLAIEAVAGQLSAARAKARHDRRHPRAL